ncbi:hypothetical protein HGO34_13415 [Agrobacterium vitis]|uniref:Uncharacterized protein n=1 Tax=Agrobacterium vitis TaxID=373 RepID=A0AAE4WE48_AGRVI|nr:hypothetical protein [Agrobacterium vitis]MCF1499646.1 hypothetical protein [Allorhizobium sp. Av2]MCM2440714.1 hypothetical protein [Agrobacterium vitis]MUZ59307.1 hypothetical protein [Agrobacterium vitis]MVA66538.1 hypothetical protein [Agrobacterium vitis]MVA87399.1 hypothetical protein [Agrobacterium vitis]
MTTVHTPQKPDGARAFPFGAAELAEAVEGYLDAISFLDAAIFVTDELYGMAEFTGSEDIIRALPRLLKRARGCIDKAGDIAMDLEQDVRTPCLWFVPKPCEMPEGDAA